MLEAHTLKEDNFSKVSLKREKTDQFTINEEIAPEQAQTLEKVHTSEEISLNYISTRESWDRKKIIVDIFAYVIAVDFVNEDFEPKV